MATYFVDPIIKSSSPLLEVEYDQMTCFGHLGID